MPRTLAAALTPLTDGGSTLDESAVEPYHAFLAAGGVDGILLTGTTGEGMLLSVAERMRLLELAARGPLEVIAHCGAQSTAATVELATHAARIGVAGVAVIAPPYFPLDADELVAHFVAAASACDPLPFYVYEFAGRSGYAIPVAAIERVRERAPNLRGLKVSDTPIEAVEPYLALGGLDVFVGSEPIALAGMERGAIGTVSGLATAFPDVTAALVHERSSAAHANVSMLRDRLRGIPFHAALKQILVARDVLRCADVRAPLRGLTDDELTLVLGLPEAVGTTR